MKALYQLYFKDFIKNWFTYVLIHLVYSLLLKYSVDSGNKAFIEIVDFFGIIIIATPFILFFGGADDFSKSINWLINSFYSRKKLILFYSFTQPIRFILVILPYALFSDDGIARGIVLKLFQIGLNTMNLLTIFLVFISFLYIVPLLNLGYAVNVKRVREANVASANKRKFKIIELFVALVLIIFVLLGITLLSEYIFPSPIVLCFLLNVILVAIAISNLNKAFRLFVSIKKIQILFLILNTLFFSIYYAGNQKLILNIDTDLAIKVRAYMFLGKISPKVDKKLYEQMIASLEPKKAYELAEINSQQMDQKYLLDAAIRANYVQELINSFYENNTRVSPNNLIVFINWLSSINKKSNIPLRNKQKIHAILVRSKFTDSNYINLLLSRGNNFDQYIAFEIIRHHVAKEKHWFYLEPYKEILDEKLIRESFEDDYFPKELENYYSSKVKM